MRNLLDWHFYVTWINLLLMKHKLVNFDWIVNNLIVHKLLINYLKKAGVRRCSVAVLKSQKQRLADVLQNSCLYKFRNVQRKTSLLESLFNKVEGQQLSCKYCESFKNSLFNRISLVTASEKILSFPGKHGGRGVISLSF